MSDHEKISEQQKMLTQVEYFPSDKALHQQRMHAKTQCHQFNLLPPSDYKKGMLLLKDLFAKSAGFWIEPQFYCDYGYNISLGKHFYANHGLVILDAAPVSIGDNVLLAPGVLISTATHPVDPQKRKKGIETAHPIRIGNNVWIGMGAKILPGVTIGDNAVIAAGAVVNKDVLANTVNAGVPAKMISNIEV
ncbi:sugar O-acetyltransferase [Aliiglaciecola sp. LCG003]|uniref:sugar O-acetyltransferase n=1 Tax=Aliiglaciecola sp. LCG003 TaxID=3053655 RepID=UPI0025741C5C|nr:sugar O-acetyltransferase [Aliiglaciecola sp. LCG003]WJG08140.1 sugar O-acetyltransferase [Aliiglaciecola sp. LCG003]